MVCYVNEMLACVIHKKREPLQKRLLENEKKKTYLEKIINSNEEAFVEQ